MSTKESKTIKKFKEVVLKEKIKVVISNKAFSQISFLTQRISKVEWSAILLYTVEGHITEPEKMVCTVDSLYLMDKGSLAFTNHNYEAEDILEMFEDFPEYMNMKIGHIHSHNSMGSFFSGTDMAELHDNAPNHAYYLSLIVNNEGIHVAKLCFVGKQEIKSKFSMKNEVGKWIWTKFIEEENEDVLFIHDCDITLSMIDGKKFYERFNKVINKPVAPIQKLETPTSTYNYTGYRETTSDYMSDYLRSIKGEYTDKDYKLPKLPVKRDADNIPNRTLYAKAIIQCSLEGLYSKSLFMVTDTVEKQCIKDDDDSITAGYLEFFSVTSPTFLFEAFNEIYTGANAKEDLDVFIHETESAVALITGRIGDCIREAVEDVLMEVFLMQEEEEEAQAEALKLNEQIKNLV